MKQRISLAVIVALGMFMTVGITQTKAESDPFVDINVLVVLDLKESTSSRLAIDLIESQGGSIYHVFPPRILMGSFPTSLDSTLTGQRGIQAIYRTKVDPQTIDLDDPLSHAALQTWNALFIEHQALSSRLAPVESTPKPLVDDALVVPVSEGPASLMAPGFDDTSSYMIGSIAVSIIFPESNGSIDPNSEDWTAVKMDQSVSEIVSGLNWWAAQESRAHISFYYEVRRSIPTDYEPITNSDPTPWLIQVMGNLGYADENIFQSVRRYDNDLRNNFGTDWAYTVFVVNDTNDEDNQFPDGRFAYAYYYGPWMVMTYDNDGWGFDNMDMVLAHEMGHTFGAMDEYRAEALCTDRGGYLDGENQNNVNPACLSNVDCIMRGSPLTVEYYTRVQIGWRDTDGDNILDPVDTTPQIILNAYSPDPTSNHSLTYTGSATDQPYDSPTRTDVTINTITNVQYRVDGNSWTGASPGDGSFDSDNENFTFIIGNLGDGSHTIEARALNSVGNYSNIASDSVTITSVPDLQPYAPSGYPYPIVPSSIKGTHTANTLYALADTFFDWHFINTAGAFSGSFHVELWVDGTRHIRYPYSGYGAGGVGGFDDWSIPDLAAGVHTLKLITDPDNTIIESDETNNEWSAQFTWEPITAWKGEYFDNETLSGCPWLTRDDFALDFDWQYDSPDPSLSSDNFSARWTRTVDFPAGSYRFHMLHDDGARLFVDGILRLDSWETCCTWDSVDVNLSTGNHAVRMEMYESGGAAYAALWWERLDVTGWRGEYYNNLTLSDHPIVVRDDGEYLNFDWEGESPDPLVNSEFSARWTRTINFTGGDYRFDLFHDDGVRFYVDNILVGDWWCTGCRQFDNVDLSLMTGPHDLVLEMVDDGGWAAAQLAWQLLNPTFTDVPYDYSVTYGGVVFPLHDHIQALYDASYTKGCITDPLSYCPDNTLTRVEAAVFMLRGLEGTSYAPPTDPGGYVFTDDWSSPTVSWGRSWSEGMWDEGLTSGCQASPKLFCPATTFTRAEASVFGLRIENGAGYTPSVATHIFADDWSDPMISWAEAWAEQAYLHGLLPACGESGGKPLFCPADLVTRAWAAYLVVEAKDLMVTH